jgi:hypothetical protein
MNLNCPADVGKEFELNVEDETRPMHDRAVFPLPKRPAGKTGIP